MCTSHKEGKEGVCLDKALPCGAHTTWIVNNGVFQSKMSLKYILKAARKSQGGYNTLVGGEWFLEAHSVKSTFKKFRDLGPELHWTFSFSYGCNLQFYAKINGSCHQFVR